MMFLSLRLICLVFAFEMCHGSHRGIYDCRRESVGCSGGGSCAYDQSEQGSCTCNPGRYNYDCGTRGPILSCPSSVTCRGGLCTNETGTVRCRCDVYSLGPGCSVPRTEVECDATRMVIKVRPFEAASYAAVHVWDYGDVPACLAEDIPDSAITGSTVKQLIVSLEQGCGQGAAGVHTLLNQPTTGDKTYTVRIRARHQPGLLSTYDTHITAYCYHRVNNIYPFAATMTVDYDNRDGYIPWTMSGYTEGGPEDVSFHLFLKTSPYRPQMPMRVGETAYVRAILGSTANFAALRMENCWTSDKSRGSQGAKVIQLFTSGCPIGTNTVKMILRDVPARSIESEQMFEFAAFRFDSSATVYIFCDVKLCRSANVNECTSTACGIQRRKRDNNHRHHNHYATRFNMTTTMTSFVVMDLDDAVPILINGDTEPEIHVRGDRNENKIIIIVAVSSIVVFAMTTTVAILLMMLRRVKSRDSNKQ